MFKHTNHLIGKTLALLLIFSSQYSFSQQTRVYFVQFVDKVENKSAEELLSLQAIKRRLKYNIGISEDDYPVNSSYVQQVTQDTSISLRYTLKWHNAAVVSSDLESLDYLTELKSVKSVSYVGKAPSVEKKESPAYISPVVKLKESVMNTSNLTETDYGVAYEQNKQIGVVGLHKKGYDGYGVQVAVFDAGFKNIDRIPAFTKHQAHQLLTFGFDIAELDNEINISDNHGTSCASCIGAYEKGKYIGSAPRAHFTLFRTEYGATEYPVEELNWCKAAELADSIGIDLITSSLGYNRYDDSTLSYTHADLNGKTSYISISARKATEKGIVVVNSAGNEGKSSWRKIGTPADVPEVLTVGAVSLEGKIGSFSSQGYNADGVVKPDISACGVLASVASPNGGYYQGYGTSYATPIAAGGVACIMQAFPQLSPTEICALIRSTSTYSASPDSLYGYGIAQFDVAYEFQKSKIDEQTTFEVLKIDTSALVLYNKNGDAARYKLYYTKNFGKLFNYKKRIQRGKIDQKANLSRIVVQAEDIDCSKKYTLKLKTKNAVRNESLTFSDLYICNM